MITSLLIASALLQRPSPGLGGQTPGPIVMMGWHDELDSRATWAPLGVVNQARVSGPPGIMLLSLGQVPADWPYTYQWGGFTQDAQVDIAHYPVLMARVTWVKGYAHMDIDVLDGNNKAVKTCRTPTLNNPGISQIDLRTVLDPAWYRLRLRLIVGGENSGCEATYDWVRFVGKKDAEFLTQNPDWKNIRLAGTVDR